MKKGQRMAKEQKDKISQSERGKKISEETRIKLRKSHLGQKGYWIGKKRLYKNPEERNKKIRESFLREKNHQWKGGITPENTKIRMSLEYRIWRDTVYRKDNWICRLCNKKCGNKEIIAHHLKLFSKFPELRFSIDNGITLCRKCHLEIHKNLCRM